MRTVALVLAVFATLVLSGCASDAIEFPPRNGVAPDGLWKTHTLYVVPSPVLPTVDTSVQREALRRTPHGADRFNGQR